MHELGSHAVGRFARTTLCAAASVAVLSIDPSVKHGAIVAPYLVVPLTSARIDANDKGAFTVPPETVREIALNIPIGGSQVSYGSIHTKVNTESADMAMTSKSKLDDIELKLDLAAASGFLFK